MKKLTISFLLLVSSALAAVAYVGTGRHFWRGEEMSPEAVASTWGKSAFDAEKFKNGSEEVRATMAYSLVSEKKKDYIGKNRSVIRQELGDHDGHYFSDMYPAYIIGGTKKGDPNTWQILFLIDKDQNISDVVVHKNCCDK